MKKFLIIMLSAVLLMTTSCSSEEPGKDPKNQDIVEDVNPLPTTKSINLSRSEQDAMGRMSELAFEMNAVIADNYAKVFDFKNGNYSFSPISAVMCISLIANSVDTNTSTMICDKLGFDSLDELNSLNTKLLQYLPAKENGVDMRLVNSVWYHNKDNVSKSYREKLAQMFGASVYGRDFNIKASVDEVNAWAARNTENMITDIIDELDADGQALFANAMYFAGSWENRFDKTKTRQEDFKGTQGTQKTAMMHGSLGLLHYSDNDMEAVIMPFAGNNYELDILMPTDNCEKPLSAVRFNEIMDGAKTKAVELSLPAFELEGRALLGLILSDMGMNIKNFSFDPMGFANPKKHLFLTMVQDTKVMVDEDGAKAAAVTHSTPIGWGGGEGSKPEKVVMTVDRPFFYVIRNNRTGAVAMMGRICNL